MTDAEYSAEFKRLTVAIRPNGAADERLTEQMERARHPEANSR